MSGVSDREWDRRLRIRTIGREDEADPDYSPYEPTPYAVLLRLADSGHVRRRHRLLDYGCGKGRVALFMASVVGCCATGIDQSQKLIDLAVENRKSARLGDRVTLRRALAEQYYPVDEDVFFFFNPFSERVFAAVLRNLRRAREERPRPMTLICYYPSEEYIQCLDADGAFEPADIIDTNDLFGGNDPRERIVVYRTAGSVE